jgi:hypothetical protein
MVQRGCTFVHGSWESRGEAREEERGREDESRGE